MGPSESKRKKQNKKNENEIKNIFGFSKDGIKSCSGQDTYSFFGFEVENTNIRFMGVYDGHGDKGKEASTFIEKEIKKLVLAGEKPFEFGELTEKLTTKLRSEQMDNFITRVV